MAEQVIMYAVVHQPRRLKLPAEPIQKGARPADIEQCLFDEAMNERYFHKVATWCYYPATEMFLGFADEGLKFSIGFSLSALRQAEMWDAELFSLFQKLARHPNVELVNVEPYHSFLPLIDLPAFASRMAWSRDHLERLIGKRPEVTDTTEMLMSDPIYHALNSVGFSGALMDGRPWVMEWREPTHLYHQGKKLMLLPRHYQLSDDVGYRFSNKGWWGYPLMADAYAHWVRQAWGDFVVLAWDYETFGEHHSKDTGIFDFMKRLPDEFAKRGVNTMSPSEAIARFREASHELPLPAFPSTWAGEGGLEFFLGNPAQQAVFHLMLEAYNKAQLTKDKKVKDLALWLMQSDNLHLIQWFGRSGSEAEVSAYFTPKEWWNLGPSGIIWEIQQVYKNFIRALDTFL
ncbi:MAG: glycoside hydrolase family 57 protein [Dehalococcoidia bacterium]|nr:glycoside hydrolase family 57 protein [Dehalococcoidia bacterium]